MRRFFLAAATSCSLLLPLAARAKPDLPALELTPDKVNLILGEGKQFDIRVKGVANPGPIRWLVVEPDGGSVTPSGYYLAPPRATTPTTIHLRASADGPPRVAAEALVFLQPVLVSVQPEEQGLTVGDSAQFRAQVKGTGDQRVRWTVEGGTEHGSITANGLYSSPTRLQTPNRVTVRATSLADPTKSATAALRIDEIRIQINPKEVTLKHGGAQRFEARVGGTPNAGVVWKVLDEQGEISPTGLYTTPPVMETPTVVTVVASSAADPTKTATARIRMEPIVINGGGPRAGKKKHGPQLIDIAGKVLRSTVQRVTNIYLPLNPIDLIVRGPNFIGKSGKQYVPLGGAVALTAHVTNSNNERIRWAVEGRGLGEVGEDGVYQAPDQLTTPQVVQIKGTAVADPTKSITYTLHIPPVVVRTERATLSCPLDGVLQLQAKAENCENDALSWEVEGGERFGTVTESGLYRPPDRIATPALIRVRAISTADPSKFIVFTLNIQEVGLELSPGSAEVRPGRTVRLRARVRGFTTQPEVLWKVTPEIGTIAPDGVYQAPADGGAQVVQITATLRADPTKTATATVRLSGK